MNAYDAIQKIIETRFNDQWGSTAPVVYENAQPGDVGEEYVRLSIAWGGAEPYAIAPALSREVGIIFLQIFIPSGIGGRRALELAEVAKPIFNEKIINDETDNVLIYCDPSGLESPGEREGYYQLNMKTSFEFRRE